MEKEKNETPFMCGKGHSSLHLLFGLNVVYVDPRTKDKSGNRSTHYTGRV